MREFGRLFDRIGRFLVPETETFGSRRAEDGQWTVPGVVVVNCPSRDAGVSRFSGPLLAGFVEMKKRQKFLSISEHRDWGT